MKETNATQDLEGIEEVYSPFQLFLHLNTQVFILSSVKWGC